MDKQPPQEPGLVRRDFLKAAVGVPVLALFGLGINRARAGGAKAREFQQALEITPAPPPPVGRLDGDPIRLGLIGAGRRGRDLLVQCLRPGLNISIEGVCDVFDVHAEEALAAARAAGHRPRRFRTYRELLASKEVDAVVIATPDHWHAPMAIDAADARKHVYLEKCMTNRVRETYALRDAVRRSRIVLQVGHQHRQTQSFLTAQSVIRKQILGHVSLVQASTNRSDRFGAWNYPIHPQANPRTIDWRQFLGNAPVTGFDTEHFFRWRQWWAYGTGLAGDLLTHDFDRINCVLGMGIPTAVTASGGIYAHRDRRQVPDVLQVTMEYPDFVTDPAVPERGMSFMYSATLGSGHDRGTLLMGREATLELGASLVVYADPNSSRYRLRSGQPLFVYDPRRNEVDAVTSASLSYFADKGLLYTYRDGKLYDPAYLHLREWLSCIRHGGRPSCGIEAGFEEAITAHMATISYRLGKRIGWDRRAQRLTNVSSSELESIRMT